MRYLAACVFIMLLMPAASARACGYSLPTFYGLCPIDGESFGDYLGKIPEESKCSAGYGYLSSTGAREACNNFGELSIKIISLDPHESEIMLFNQHLPWPTAVLVYKDTPKCPRDGLLVHKDSYLFHESAYTPEDIDILKAYVATPEYQKMLSDEASGWVAAKLQEKLGEPLGARRHALLRATWQASGDKYDFYAREAIKSIEAFLLDPAGPKDEKTETWHLILGELHRRIGDFDEAESIFKALIREAPLTGHGSYPELIAFELELIESGDKSPHHYYPMPENKTPRSQSGNVTQ